VAASRLRSLLASPRLCIVVVKQVQLIIPRSENQLVLDNRFLLIFLIADTPVHGSRDQFVLFFNDPVFVLLLFKGLDLLPVLYVYGAAPTTLVPDEQFAISFVHADAGDIRLGQVSKDRLQRPVDSIPNFDALSVRCYECVEDWVV